MEGQHGSLFVLSRGEWACIALELTESNVSRRIYDQLNGNLITRDLVAIDVGRDANAVHESSQRVRKWDRERYREAALAAISHRREDIS